VLLLFLVSSCLFVFLSRAQVVVLCVLFSRGVFDCAWSHLVVSCFAQPTRWQCTVPVVSPGW
jgi:hypothetical protein